MTNASGSGAGSLRLAIVEADAATGSSTITFAPTFFATPKTIAIDSQFELGNASEIFIVGPSASLSIDAQNSGRVFEIDSGTTAEIDNLTIINGEDDGADGGAILNNGGTASATFSGLTLNEDYSQRGGMPSVA